MHVAQARPGEVTLVGTVRQVGEPVRAPISGARAVGYWSRVDEEKSLWGWSPAVQMRALTTFELEDDTGRIRVEVDASQVAAMLRGSAGRSGPFKAAPGVVVHLLRRHGRGVQGVIFQKAYRWREQVLLDGARVRVRGQVIEVAPHEGAGGGGGRPAGDFGAYRDAPVGLRVTGSRGAPVVIVLE